jgi:hypothetical protein
MAVDAIENRNMKGGAQRNLKSLCPAVLSFPSSTNQPTATPSLFTALNHTDQ